MQEKKGNIINSNAPNYSTNGPTMMDCLIQHQTHYFPYWALILAPKKKNFNIHLKINLLKSNVPTGSVIQRYIMMPYCTPFPFQQGIDTVLLYTSGIGLGKQFIFEPPGSAVRGDLEFVSPGCNLTSSAQLFLRFLSRALCLRQSPAAPQAET